MQPLGAIQSTSSIRRNRRLKCANVCMFVCTRPSKVLGLNTHMHPHISVYPCTVTSLPLRDLGQQVSQRLLCQGCWRTVLKWSTWSMTKCIVKSDLVRRTSTAWPVDRTVRRNVTKCVTTNFLQTFSHGDWFLFSLFKSDVDKILMHRTFTPQLSSI